MEQFIFLAFKLPIIIFLNSTAIAIGLAFVKGVLVDEDIYGIDEENNDR